MLRLYWKIVIRPNLRKILILGTVSLLAAMAEVASIGLVMPVIALSSGMESQSGQKFLPALDALARGIGLAPNSSELLYVALASVAVFIILKSALVMWLNYLTAYASQDTKRGLTLRMFAAYGHARYSELIRRERGGVTKDIEKPADAMGYVVYYSGLSIAAAGQVVLTLAFLAWLSPGLTLLMMALGLTTVYVSRYAIQERMARLGGTDYSLEQACAGMLVNVIDGARIVKAHNLVDRLRAHLDSLLERRTKIAVHQLVFQQIPKIVFELVGMLFVVMLFSLAQLVPSLGLDFPALAAFVLALRQITPAASTLNSNFLNMAQYWGQIRVIEEVLTRLPQEDSTGGSASLPGVIRTVRLESINFAYAENASHKVLHDLSLTFERGKVTAIVGATGAGKTTIADLIIRLQEPAGGRIVADGVDIRQFPLAGWRERIGYVGQDVFLFNATLGENIAALDGRVPMADIVRAAKLAQIHDFIVSLPDSYNTSVGDRGVTLSGGQRQRIAVARAILRRPEILILDEATSALDTLTERALHSAIEFIRHDAIVILIAHRLSTVEDADEILVLQDGQVVERGSHGALLARQGLYAQLHRAAPEPAPVPPEQV